MTWSYRVPKFAGSHWEAIGFEAFEDGDPDLPTIGVYCDRDGHDAYLIGMFTFHADSVPSQQWRFGRGYPTGAGEIIMLPAGDDTSFILHDKPLRGPVDGNLDTTAPAGRIRDKLKCKTCRYRRAFRRETLQAPLTALWVGGIKEITVQGLARSVENVRA